MIGLVGPADSVALAVDVAQASGLAGRVVARAYDRVEDAVGLARELDAVCQTILFTGRVPYAFARAAGGFTAGLRYVPHSGADLYRMLVQLLRARAGALPRISLDTIDPAVVAEAYADLGLEPPEHVLPLEVDGDPDRLRSLTEIVAFHRGLAAAGATDIAVTCVGAVDAALRAEGHAVWRIGHSRSVLRDALRQADLAARLALTERTQPAAIVVRPAPSAPVAPDPGPYEEQRRRLRRREAVLDLAERLRGRLADGEDGSAIVYASRGTVEGAISRLLAGQGGPFDPDRLPPDLRVGVGIGATLAAAEENAERSLVMAEDAADLHVTYPDGAVLRATRSAPPATYRLRETDAARLRIARELGLGPLALARLTRALRQVDAGAVTAAELAAAYGIAPRSARRMMTALQRAGIALPLGRQGGPRAGRPQTVYRIDVSRLLPADAG